MEVSHYRSFDNLSSEKQKQNGQLIMDFYHKQVL